MALATRCCTLELVADIDRWPVSATAGYQLAISISCLHPSWGKQGFSGAGTRWNTVPANILEPGWHSGKYRWPQVESYTEAFRQITSYSLGWPSISLFSGPNCPQTRDLASKMSKNFPGVIPPQQEGATPPAPTSSTATCRARGCKLLCCWDLGLGNRSPKSKFTTTPLEANPLHIAAAYWLPINGTDRQMNTQVLQTLSAYCVASINNSIKNVPILVIFGTVFLPKTDDLKKFQLLHICCTATLISDKQYDRKG